MFSHRMLPSLVAGLLALTVGNARAASPIGDDEYRDLAERLHVKKQPWAQIPWRASLTAARQAAAAEGKPIFLVVNTGNCLGFV